MRYFDEFAKEKQEIILYKVNTLNQNKSFRGANIVNALLLIKYITKLNQKFE